MIDTIQSVQILRQIPGTFNRPVEAICRAANGLDFILSKHDFNRLEYPAHLLRIGLFDLWVGNNDRTEENYNLFLTRGKKQKLVVFDHFEAFNKISEHALTKIHAEIDVYEKAFLSSSYPYEMLSWVPKTQMKHELESFMENIRKINVEEQIEDIATTFPDSWNVKEETIQYILRFLRSEERLVRIEEEVINYIKYLPEKG